MEFIGFADLLKRFGAAGNTVEALAAQGVDVSQTLVRRWWFEEILPPRYWRAFVAACQAKGWEDVTLERLARISEEPRADRLARMKARDDAAAACELARDAGRPLEVAAN